MPNSIKPRQPRMRASCDGCFLAKVKCSKSRPICSRCLTCGIECRYSPSSRAGKPKASESAKNQQHHSPTTMSSVPPPDPIMYPGWTSPSASISPDLTFVTLDSTPAMSGDFYGPLTMPWTPPQDMSATFADSPMPPTTMPSTHSRAPSYDAGNGSTGWVNNPCPPDLFGFNPVSTSPNMASNYFPSPTATPNMRTVSPRPKSTPANTAAGGSCTCFTVCLQSLQALHNASSPSYIPFDLVLSLNRKAVEGCAAMLGCTKCTKGSGKHTATMLLVTLISTITTFYKNASQFFVEPTGDSPSPPASSSPSSTTSGLGVSVGGYMVNTEDSRLLGLVVLTRELHKLEEVFASFQEWCSDSSEDPRLSQAMIGYLGQSLGATLQAVSHRKGDMGFSWARQSDERPRSSWSPNGTAPEQQQQCTTYAYATKHTQEASPPQLA